ncbi:HAMP domain-containing sensor histidine kinase [Kribbella sp. NPDC003557]|uniref:sensor histidine kinase n=1 Tax=Kribbella sp. NPDC003557 TaxID=3154449 RepID=UPI00339ED185
MSVRLRLTLIATLVVGGALVAGGFVLVGLLSSALTDQVCAATGERAAYLASTAAPEVDAPPSVELVQYLDRSGAVVGRSDAARLADPGARCVAVEPPGHDEDYAFVSAAVTRPRPDGAEQVVVGRPLVDVLDSTRYLTRVLVIGLLLVLVLVALVTWLVAGRVLAPVAAIRREVDEISATELHRRVPTRHSADEIGRLATTMNRMLDRLEHAHDSHRRFVADASHELRSPVASIRQHAEVALAHPDRTTLGALAGTVLAEDLRMQRLIDDLLVLAKADERNIRLPMASIDLDDLVFDEARRLRDRTDLLIGTSAVSAGRVSGDEASLRRLVANLAENAARYARGRIAFGLVEADGLVVLSVSDDGPGIPPAERDRVFERFVRVGEDRSRADGGSGLGLAIVAQVARTHGGNVQVARSLLGGATLEVRLPAADA